MNLSVLKKFWWVILLVLIVAGASAFLIFSNRLAVESLLTSYPICPGNLSGLLTYPLMETKYISALIPFGNLNPPGHTSPVGHNYFLSPSEYVGKDIPLYHPADSWITHIGSETKLNETTGKYEPSGYTIDYTLCSGVKIAIAGYIKLSPEVLSALNQSRPKGCKEGIVKPGHGTSGGCDYELNYKVRAGQIAGWAIGDLHQTIEVWAFNYNSKPREDVDWGYYNYGNYPYAFCLFDLYSGELKEGYYQKFGVTSEETGGKEFNSSMYSKNISFIPRTTEPKCGEINQDIVGTIQGMWWGEDKKTGNDWSIEFDGKGLAFVHDNINPTMGAISIGGNIMQNAEVVYFTPAHSGTTNREPSEVKADGKIYCYQDNARDWNGHIIDKIIVQLIDDHHLKIENQDGDCTGSESFVNPFTYQR